MQSLADAYDRRASAVSRRRLLLGVGLFGAGATMLLAGVVAGATPLLSAVGFTWWEARELAGVLAGLGVPAVFVGVFSVLPATERQRAAATVGGIVALLGVVLFRYAYPYQWYGGTRMPSTMAMFTVLVYFAGAITTFWCLFAAAATFKRRNDPGGTVTLEFTRGGETREVTVSAEDADAAKRALGGGVGVFGGVDDPDRESGGATAASDGGATDRDIREAGGGEVMEEPTPAGGAADTYCGTCAHFQYVRTEKGITPYCGHHDELMDDMDACEDWQPKRS